MSARTLVQIAQGPALRFIFIHMIGRVGRPVHRMNAGLTCFVLLLLEVFHRWTQGINLFHFFIRHPETFIHRLPLPTTSPAPDKGQP